MDRNESIMETTGVLYCHQGFTDIVNCLAMINYYSGKYKNLIVLMRKDAENMINFYVRKLGNITMLYADKNVLDSANDSGIVRYLETKGLSNYACQFIGFTDRERNDIYQNNFSKSDTTGNFVKEFYQCYKIPYETRIEMFSIVRDAEAEERKYTEIVGDSKQYICKHVGPRLGYPYQVIKVDTPSNVKSIDLYNSSDVFFDMIKVLENSSEIHVIDSVWAAICYHLDAKYGLLKNVPVSLYCHNGHNKMFVEPIALPNWTIHYFR